MPKPVVKKEYPLSVRIYLYEIIKGLGITWKHFVKNVRYSFRKGPHTVPTTWQYPEDRRPISPNFRGAHMLQLNDKGQELCVGCGMCARACPAKCIVVKRGKPEEGEADKYAGKTMCTEFSIDMLRCIFCGFCEESCPKNALVLGQGHELAEYTMEACIYDKAKLIANFEEAKAEGKLKPKPKKVPVEAPPKDAAKKPVAKKAAAKAKAPAAKKAEPEKASESKPDAKAETKAEAPEGDKSPEKG